jgi:hypothetical protein
MLRIKLARLIDNGGILFFGVFGQLLYTASGVTCFACSGFTLAFPPPYCAQWSSPCDRFRFGLPDSLKVSVHDPGCVGAVAEGKLCAWKHFLANYNPYKRFS